MELFPLCPSTVFLRRTVRLIRSTQPTSSELLAAIQTRFGARVGGDRTRLSPNSEGPFDSTSRTQKRGSGLIEGFRPSLSQRGRVSTRVDVCGGLTQTLEGNGSQQIHTRRLVAQQVLGQRVRGGVGSKGLTNGLLPVFPPGRVRL